MGTPRLLYLSALFCLLHAVLNCQGSPSEFEGKVVLVTGGTTGIGFATALRFAQKGSLVVFCAKNESQGLMSQLAIRDDEDVIAAGGNATFFQADVSNLQEVKALINFVVTTYSTLDIAVNNAGISGWIGSISTIPEDIFLNEHDAILTNLYGTFYCVREEIRYWLSENRSEGIIVNTASVAGIQGFPGATMYDASKHGIVGLTKSVAQEFDKNPLRVRINAVAPGFISTPMVWNGAKMWAYGEQYWEGPQVQQDSTLWEKYKKVLESSLPGGKIGEPENVADAITFLASDQASFVSGSILTIDNGDF